MSTIVLGIGQAAGGDDGVGLAVARAAASRGLVARECGDATALVHLLQDGHRVVVVDAVVGGGDPGAVLHLAPDQLGAGPRPVSSHGLGVVDALALASLALGPGALERVHIVGVVIERPTPGADLSPPVAEAVARATDAVASIVEP